MKKYILILAIAFSSLLVGCEPEEEALSNLKYVDLLVVKDVTVVVFESENGKEKTLLVGDLGANAVFSMDEGKIYNVTFTKESLWWTGDYILTAVEVKEK